MGYILYLQYIYTIIVYIICIIMVLYTIYIIYYIILYHIYVPTYIYVCTSALVYIYSYDLIIYHTSRYRIYISFSYRIVVSTEALAISWPPICQKVSITSYLTPRNPHMPHNSFAAILRSAGTLRLSCLLKRFATATEAVSSSALSSSGAMPTSFHKRILPASLVSFSSPQGKEIFRKSMLAGSMECFFPLSEQFVTQSGKILL